MSQRAAVVVQELLPGGRLWEEHMAGVQPHVEQLREQMQSFSPEQLQQSFQEDLARLQGNGYTLFDQSIPNFANPFAKEIAHLGLMPQRPTSSRLCLSCSKIPINELLSSRTTEYKLFDSFSPLRESAESCELCKMIYLSIELYENRDVRGIYISTDLQILLIRAVVEQTDRRTCLRICADPDSQAASMGVDVGFPILPKEDSEVYFHLLNKWIQDCNERHPNHSIIFRKDKELPTRVLNVSDSKEPNMLRLYLPPKGKQGRYIALSHCWGKGVSFMTKKDNIKTLCKAINLLNLPKTFQDAVLVTRRLGIKYLWIDSLCIIQDDKDDWRRESRRMEDVFGSAYCTIAATSAKDSNEGFLCPRPAKHSVRLSDRNTDTLYVYISEVVENFKHDVLGGKLNERGWVFQERALSPRTIHFTAEQTYWECGSVIRCENLAQKFMELNWLGDSQFPMGISHLMGPLKDAMFQDIFNQYSKLALTRPSDRPAAIFGLELRLARFYKTECTYGIFHCFLYQCLLWKRSGNEMMKPIKDSRFEVVPSWSWMAYEGAIHYGIIEPNDLFWHKGIQLITNSETRDDVRHLLSWVLGRHKRNEPKSTQCPVLETQLMQISLGCHIKRHEDTNCQIRDSNGRLVGWARYDYKDEYNVESLRFMVIGMNNGRADWKKYTAVSWNEELVPGKLLYGLLVTRAPLEGSKNVYQRAGVAVIQIEHFASDKLSPIVQVI